MDVELDSWAIPRRGRVAGWVFQVLQDPDVSEGGNADQLTGSQQVRLP